MITPFLYIRYLIILEALLSTRQLLKTTGMYVESSVILWTTHYRPLK